MKSAFLDRRSLATSPAKLALRATSVAMLTACGSDSAVEPQPPPDPAAPLPNFIRLQSEAGDYIGGGQNFEYTQVNAILTARIFANLVLVSVRGDASWNGEFAVPAFSPVQVGTYAGATRFYTAESPGLTWSGEGRGCSSVMGSFSIDSLTYASGVLSSIDLRFDQRCDGAVAALRGTIHWRSDDTTKPAGPVNPPPTNLWKPDPTFVPASGTFVLLASDPGDYIGQGEFRVYTPPASPITVSSNGTRITVTVGGYTGQFVAMLGTIPLSEGYYGDLMAYPFHNQVKGGMYWSGNGRACGRLTGWFAIDRIVYSGTAMTGLEMRFEQHCEGGASALRGAIRWSG
jgi:hypothetical protein